MTLNSIGDEVWPVQTEDVIWQCADFEDGQGYFEDPLLFYLEKGSTGCPWSRLTSPWESEI